MAVLTAEQAMLKDAARAWVDDRAPVAAYRALRKSGSQLGHCPETWSEMVAMGWTAIVIPEAYGGLAFGFAGSGIVFEHLGRTLVASPLLETALVVPSALMLGGMEDQKARYLPPIASGELIAALAVDEGARHAPHGVALSARKDGSGWILSGAKRDVLGGTAARLFLVAGRTSGRPGEADGITLFLVDGNAHGLTCDPIPQIDRRGAALLRFDDVKVGPEAVLGSVDRGAPLLDMVLDRARAGLAMEMVGTATRAFEITIDHLKTRVQFGRPLGSFQALQHRAVELLGDIELARSAAEAALQAIDDGASTHETASLASLAKILACEALRRSTNEMVQMHGGIGMTDEHDAGLYLKRSRAAAVAYGDAAFHRERFGLLNGF